MNKLQKEALAHYDRMIEWAEMQPQDDHPSPQMYIEINEYWGCEDCSYCRAYGNNSCNNCPLSGDDDSCCNGLYRKMYYANTWSEWIEYAQEIKEYIKKNG